MNLTQKILRLDADALRALEKSESSTLIQKQEEETHFEQLREMQERSFETQKREESAVLTQKLESEHQKALETLQRERERFAQEFSTDSVVAHLLTVARDRVCH